jgi:hypothetical protein
MRPALVADRRKLALRSPLNASVNPPKPCARSHASTDCFSLVTASFRLCPILRRTVLKWME